MFEKVTRSSKSCTRGEHKWAPALLQTPPGLVALAHRRLSPQPFAKCILECPKFKMLMYVNQLHNERIHAPGKVVPCHSCSWRVLCVAHQLWAGILIKGALLISGATKAGTCFVFLFFLTSFLFFVLNGILFSFLLKISNYDHGICITNSHPVLDYSQPNHSLCFTRAICSSTPYRLPAFCHFTAC